MNRFILTGFAATAAFIGFTPAAAGPHNLSSVGSTYGGEFRFFDQDRQAVTDDVLSGVSGTQGLSVRNFATISSDHSYLMTAQHNGIARAEMDVWWSSTGSDLIASAVRAAQ